MIHSTVLNEDRSYWLRLPDSNNAYDRLAEVYETLGDFQKAIENYKRALQLNTNYKNAGYKMEQLKK